MKYHDKKQQQIVYIIISLALKSVILDNNKFTANYIYKRQKKFTGPYKPRTGRTCQCMNHAPAIVAAPALIYSMHRMFVFALLPIFTARAMLARSWES